MQASTAKLSKLGSHHPPRRLQGQPDDPKADRGGLRLGQGRGRLPKTTHRGLDRVGWQVTFTMAAYNLIRLLKLLASAA